MSENEGVCVSECEREWLSERERERESGREREIERERERERKREREREGGREREGERERGRERERPSVFSGHTRSLWGSSVLAVVPKLMGIPNGLIHATCRRVARLATRQGLLD